MTNDMLLNDTCMIASLPDSLLLNIASFSDPPAIYNLAHTCKAFHRSSTELSTRHILSAEADYLQMNRTVPNVASRLLKESLLYGFVSALERSNVALSIGQGRKLAQLQLDQLRKGRKVLISGSAVVQAATGKRFGNYDLDIYCTKESVPALREFLLREVGMCCQSVHPCYGERQGRVYLNETQTIHHVETYIPNSESVSTVDAAAIARRFYRAWNAQQAALGNDINALPPQAMNVDMSYLNYRNEMVYRMQKYRRHKFPKDYPFALSPQGSGRKFIELIVCRTNPEEVIEGFDLEICKCKFNGERIQVVSMEETFNSRTKSDDYIKFINCYMPVYLKTLTLRLTLDLTIPPINVLKTLKADSVSNETMMHIMHCFANTMKTAEKSVQLTVLGTEHFNILRCSENYVSIPHYFLALHNKLVTQLNRALKYCKRGIHVPINDELKAMFLDVCDNAAITPPSPKRARH